MPSNGTSTAKTVTLNSRTRVYSSSVDSWTCVSLDTGQGAGVWGCSVSISSAISRANKSRSAIAAGESALFNHGLCLLLGFDAPTRNAAMDAQHHLSGVRWSLHRIFSIHARHEALLAVIALGSTFRFTAPMVDLPTESVRCRGRGSRCSSSWTRTRAFASRAGSPLPKSTARRIARRTADISGTAPVL